MKKLLTLALVCSATAIVGAQVTSSQTIAPKNVQNVAIKNSEQRTAITTDGHFPWDDSEYKGAFDSGVDMNTTDSGKAAHDTMIAAYNAGGFVDATTAQFKVTEITLNGRTCGEISIAGSQAITTNKLSIPATLDGKEICKIADNAFANNSSTSMPSQVRIDAAIEEIGDGAFMKASNGNASSMYQQVFMPNTVRKIGAQAFRGTGLRFFARPKLLEEIGDYAFSDMNMTTRDVCDGATGGIAQLHFNTFPNNKLTTIGEKAFFCNTGAGGNIWLPEGVTSVGASAFLGNNSGGIVIPKSLTTENIGDAAFQYRNASNAFGWGYAKNGGINIKHDVLADDWTRWFGSKDVKAEAGIRVKLAAFDTDAEFAKNKFYYQPEASAPATFNFTPDQTREVNFNSVTEDFVLPASITYTPAGIITTPQWSYKVDWESSDPTVLDVTTNATEGTVNAATGLVQITSSIKQGLAIITRAETEWKTVKLTGKVLNPVSGVTHTKEYTVKIKPMQDVPDPDVVPTPDPEPTPTPPAPTSFDWSWIWWVIGGLGALLLGLFFIILFKRRKKDDEDDKNNPNSTIGKNVNVKGQSNSGGYTAANLSNKGSFAKPGSSSKL